MAADVVSGAWVGSRAVAELNANLLDGSESESTSDTDLFADWEVQKARLETDCELYCDIASNPRSDFFNQLAEVSDDLAWGAVIPPHTGAVGLVEVKFADDDWRPADETATLAQLTRWKYGPIYAGLGADIYGRHLITLDLRIYFLGLAARTYLVPEYEFDDAGYTHKCPERLTPAQIRGTIVKLYKDGVDPQMVEFQERLYQADRERVRAGEIVVSDFIPFVRPVQARVTT